MGGTFKPAVTTTSTIKPKISDNDSSSSEAKASSDQNLDDKIPEGETEINIDLEVNSDSDSNLKSENELLVQIIGDHESDSEKIDKVAESFEAEKDWFKQQLSDLDKWWNAEKEIVKDDSVNDRDESGKIMNVEGQKRNPRPRPGGSSRPKPIVINSPYESDYDPYYSTQQQHVHYNSYPVPQPPPNKVYYTDPNYDAHIDRLLSQLINKILQHFLHSFERSDPDYESDVKEYSVSASITSDDSCGGGYISWSLCMIGL